MKAHQYTKVRTEYHRLIPSRFPTINLFDWVQSAKELEEVATLEGLTNDRLSTEYGELYRVAKEDWVSGPGATILMAPFTHPGESRFTDGTYGVYYAGDSLQTAIAETKFHRERFLNASKETPCLLQMREYTTKVQQSLVDITRGGFKKYCHPDPTQYSVSQAFGRELKESREWGLLYPSVRMKGKNCVAIFRPPALTIPVQGCHLDYIWDGNSISEVRLSESIAS